jgi:HlyD family secretion protein
MQRRAKSRRIQTLCLLAFVCSALVGVGILAIARSRSNARVSLAGRYFTTGVRRADLFPKLMAMGRVESSKRTIIECDLENVMVGVRGQRLAAGGAAILLSVIPEGTTVKRGDVLAVIDSSEYEELVRIQKIAVERSAADHVTAALDLEIAKLAVREFEKGTMHETIEDFEGKVFLARSDVERANDRVAWAHRMKEKGYIAAAAATAADYTQNQAKFGLAQQESAYQLFVKYTAPKTAKVLQGAVASADLTLGYQALRLARNRERYALLEKQVEHCTIRAPHDGFVIYANNVDRQVFIEAGMPVRQRQQLFFLPDLTQMEVVASIHESIVERISPSMRAHVQVEGIGNRSIEGYVTSIAPMTTFSWRTTVGYFEGIVKLENVPEGLKPGMTAEVEISMPRRENVLAVPPEAILIDHGYDICFVVHDDSLERRQVKLGNTTRDLVEVTQGLEDGEQVVLNPHPDDPELELLSQHGDAAPAVPSPIAGAVAASH